MASQPIYQFYAELNNYQPKIWRRFQVPGNITMARLGYILMTLYEMQASHLFCITVPVREKEKGKSPLMLLPTRCALSSRDVQAKN